MSRASSLLRCGSFPRNSVAAWGKCLALTLFLARPWAAHGAELPPARTYLQQALATARLVPLGGDQSSLRREVALALLSSDPAAAQQVIAGVGRPSDAARALAALATARAAQDPAGAREAANLGGRLLQRIVEPARRDQEFRLFLREIAALGADAPAAAPEVPTDEARQIVVEALAERDPATALALRTRWALQAPAADAALAALALRLAPIQPEAAVTLASGLAAPELRDRTLWQVAEARPVTETPALAARMQDPVARAGLLTSAALRRAATDPEGALAAAQEVPVSPLSARAQVVVEIARHDPARAAELARPLPEAGRAWALGQIALLLAASQPAQAEALLSEAGAAPDLTARVATEMAPADPARALRLVRALPAPDREVALADLIVALAPTRPAEAKELVWELTPSAARDRAVGALSRRLAQDSADAGTAVLGLISDPAQLPARRAQATVAAAAHDPTTASRLLQSLPPGEVRTLAAQQAGLARLAAGATPEEAAALAALGVPRDLALRWLLPEAARLGQGALEAVAEKQEEPYWRGLGLVAAARVLLRQEAAPTPVPERLRLLRPIVEWEGS